MQYYQYGESAIPKQTAYCSDQACPCPGTAIPRGSGFLYISPEAVAFMEAKQSGQADHILMGPMPVLVCEEGARRRGLDLEIAAEDARRWWETGQVPLRATPKAGMARTRPVSPAGKGARRWLPWAMLAAVLLVATAAFLLLRGRSEDATADGQVRGLLLDAGTGQPIVGARCEINVGGSTGEGQFTLQISGDAPETVTDRSGAFLLEKVPPNPYFLTCYTDSGLIKFADGESYFFEITEGQVLDLGTISGRPKAEAQARIPSPSVATPDRFPSAAAETPVPELSLTPTPVPKLASGPPIDVANARSVQQLIALEQPLKGCDHLAFSHDGAFLASTAGFVWDVSTGQLVGKREIGNREASWSPLAAVLGSSDHRDDVIRLWDAARDQELALLEGHTGSVHLLAWSPDGTLLASSSRDLTVRLWEVETGRLLATLKLVPAFHTRYVQSFAWSPDSSVVAVAVSEQLVLMVDRTGEIVQELPLTDQWQLAWSPDGTVLACRGEAITSIWNAASGEFTHRLPSGRLAWSPDGSRLVIGAVPMVIWDKDQGKEVVTLEGYSDAPFSLAWSPDGAVLASGHSADLGIRLWDTQTGQELVVLEGLPDKVDSVAWSPDGTLLASCGYWDQAVRLWSATEGAPAPGRATDVAAPTESP